MSILSFKYPLTFYVFGAALLVQFAILVADVVADEPVSESAYGAATYAAPYLSEQSQALIKGYVPTKSILPPLDDLAAWSESQRLTEQRGANLLQAYVQSGGEFSHGEVRHSISTMNWVGVAPIRAQPNTVFWRCSRDGRTTIITPDLCGAGVSPAQADVN